MPLAADFLKVPHHEQNFVDACVPEPQSRATAGGSVGQADPFNHPAETVVDRYEVDEHQAAAH